MQNAMSVDEAETAEEHRDAEFAEAKEVITVETQTGVVLNGGANTEPLGEKASDVDNDNPFE